MSAYKSTSYRLVLTGATGGIGRCLAFALAPSCSAMLLIGRSAEKLAELRRQLQAAHPALMIVCLAADLCSEDGRNRLVQVAGAFPGGVNLLVNNAGISDFARFNRQSEERIETLIATNLTVPILLCRRLLPLLLAQERAQIINVGSVFGDLGYPGFASYCASKFGLRGFTQALRRELSDSAVAVRYFAPRATRTDLNSAGVEAMNAELGTKSDEPTAVAEVFLEFLAGQRAECILGWPEQFYVFVNRLFARITDSAIGKQLPVIRRHLPN